MTTMFYKGQFNKAEDTTTNVYVGMAADIVHVGHINIIDIAKKYGNVIIGLLTDEAIQSYKRTPIIPYEQRKTILEHIDGVYRVIPQSQLDYTQNLLMIRPEYVVHGNDWKHGTQEKTRENVISTIKAWGGKLIEPDYTQEISTTKIIETILKRNTI